VGLGIYLNPKIQRIFTTRSEAMKREKYLKSGQGFEWIKFNILKQ